MEELIISMALALLNTVIKNPAKKAELQNSLLELRDAISVAYPGQ